MTNKGSLKLDEGDVPVEVAPMPITMLYVMPSEITLEVVKLLGKAKNPEEVANNLLEKAKRTKTVKPIQQADTTEL